MRDAPRGERNPLNTTRPAMAGLAAEWFQCYGEGHERAGEEITLDATCECGQPFTQRIIAARQMEAADERDHRRGSHVVALMLRQIPHLRVPVHCPPCERASIARQARIDHARTP